MRRGLVGLVAELRLKEPAWFFRIGSLDLLFRERVLPALAGLGRMKVNSKVPPIARVCGTLMMSEAVWRWHQRLFAGEHLSLGDWEGPHKVSQVCDERQGWLGDCGMDCSRRLFAY